MKTLKFRNGDEMPILGLGTWKSEQGKVKHAVYHAIKSGYRHIDCAAIYGNENEVGEGIKQAIDEGIVKREDLWVTSKLWNDAHKKDDVKPALKSTLRDLGLDYIDLYLIHWPIAQKPGSGFPESGDDFLPLEEIPIIETWTALEEVKNEGLARHIGVSNFSKEKLQSLMSETTEMPEMNQVEMHIYMQQKELIDFCQSNDIQLTAYSPLGSMDRPDAMKKDNEPIPLEKDEVQEIAKKHSITEGQVLLAWNMSREVAVIPKSTNEDRIEENLKAADIQLDQDDLDKLNKLDKHYRFVDAAPFDMEGNSYTQNGIWDEESEQQPIEGMS